LENINRDCFQTRYKAVRDSIMFLRKSTKSSEASISALEASNAKRKADLERRSRLFGLMSGEGGTAEENLARLTAMAEKSERKMIGMREEWEAIREGSQTI
jgi:predicted Rossmann-fold nucleotide-binding protein